MNVFKPYILSLLALVSASALAMQAPAPIIESIEPKKDQNQIQQSHNQQLVTICTADISQRWALPKSTLSRCQTIKYMLEDLDLDHQEIPLSPELTIEQLEKFVPVLIKFDEIKKAELLGRDTKQELITLLHAKDHSELCMIAHAANAVECKELLEIVCMVIAQKLKASECIKECLNNGGYDFTINTNTKAQLTLDVQRLIGSKMLNSYERTKIAMNERITNHGSSGTFNCQSSRNYGWLINSSCGYNFFVDHLSGNRAVLHIVEAATGTYVGYTPPIQGHIQWASMAKNTLAIVLNNGRVLLIDRAKGDQTFLISSPIMTANLNNSGDQLITVSATREIQIWDIATRACIRTLNIMSYLYVDMSVNRIHHDACFNAAGDKIAAFSEDSSIYILETATGNILQKTLPLESVQIIKFSMAGDKILAISTGTCIQKKFEDNVYVVDGNFDQSGNKVVTTHYEAIGSRYRVYMWDIATSMRMPIFESDYLHRAVSFSKSGDAVMLYSAREIKKINIIDLATQQYLESKITLAQIAALIAVGAHEDHRNSIDQSEQTNNIIKQLPTSLRRAFFPNWKQSIMQTWNHLNPWMRSGIVAAGSGLTATAAWYGYNKWFKNSNQQ